MVQKRKELGHYTQIVGVDCLLCGKFTPGTGGKVFCYECNFRWNHQVPKKYKAELKRYNIWDGAHDHLKVWKDIMDLRKEIKGIDKPWSVVE